MIDSFPDQFPRKVAVIGGGTMGAGIAQVVVQAGFPVCLIDRTDDDLQRAISKIDANWQRALEKEKITSQEIESASRLLSTSTEIYPVVDCDFVIEAVFENPGIKQDLFRALGDITPAAAVLASNTSSISITALGDYSGRPASVTGMHFFNPVPVMTLVEVVRGEQTSDTTIARTMQFAAALGKTGVIVNDSPGFVVNRILMPMINEAIEAFRTSVATADAIDSAMKLGANHPMGPLELADFIGLDVCLAIIEILHHDFANEKYAPSPLLRELVAAGHLGKKSGQGFYTYPREERR